MAGTAVHLHAFVRHARARARSPNGMANIVLREILQKANEISRLSGLQNPPMINAGLPDLTSVIVEVVSLLVSQSRKLIRTLSPCSPLKSRLSAG